MSELKDTIKLANFTVYGLVGMETVQNKLNFHGQMVSLSDDPSVGMRMEKYQKLEAINPEKCTENGRLISSMERKMPASSTTSEKLYPNKKLVSIKINDDYS